MKRQEIVTQLGLALVLAGLSALAPSGPAHAWGATGHEFITGIAAELFPDEIPAFLRTPQAVEILAPFGREPDRDKHTGDPHDSDLNPMHYVLLSDQGAVAGVLPLRELPKTLDEYDAKLRAGGSSQYKAGYLPYAIVVGWQQLAKDFAYWQASSIGAKTAIDPADRAWFDKDRQQRELLILRDLGYWSHFPGDASMPLHTSQHFYGWGPYPNPQGYATGDTMELFVKGTFVRNNIKRDVVKSLVPAYDACACSIWDRVLQADPREQQVRRADVRARQEGRLQGGRPRGHRPGVVAAQPRRRSGSRHGDRRLEGERRHERRRPCRQHARHPLGQAHPAPGRFPLRLSGASRRAGRRLSLQPAGDWAVELHSAP